MRKCSFQAEGGKVETIFHNNSFRGSFPKIKLVLLFSKAENKSAIMFYGPKSCGFLRKTQDLWQTIEENLVRRSNNLNSKLARIQ